MNSLVRKWFISNFLLLRLSHLELDPLTQMWSLKVKTVLNQKNLQWIFLTWTPSLLKIMVSGMEPTSMTATWDKDKKVEVMRAAVGIMKVSQLCQISNKITLESTTESIWYCSPLNFYEIFKQEFLNEVKHLAQSWKTLNLIYFQWYHKERCFLNTWYKNNIYNMRKIFKSCLIVLLLLTPSFAQEANTQAPPDVSFHICSLSQPLLFIRVHLHQIQHHKKAIPTSSKLFHQEIKVHKFLRAHQSIMKSNNQKLINKLLFLWETPQSITSKKRQKG